jgi:hypothetical protein
MTIKPKYDEAHRKIFVIEDEDQAWTLLDGVVNHVIEIDDITLLEFKGWPRIEFKIQGRRWQSSVPTRIMPAILDIQKDLYRAYARVRYGDHDTRHLTDEEREALEIVVTVGEGSSEFMALIESAMNTFVTGALSRMTAEQLMITVLGLSLVIAGRLSWKDWLDSRVRQREIDARAEGENKDNVVRIELSKEETRRLEVMARAIAQQPVIKAAKEESEASKDSLMRALDGPDVISVGDIRLPGDEAVQIVRKPRESSVAIRVDGLFRILSVSPQLASFKLHLQRIEDGLELIAEARDAVLTHDMRASLQRGEWERIPVSFSINAKQLRGAITAAEVVSASIVEEY